MRTYGRTLTATVNRKGVLDIDVVKGCEHGVAAHGPLGCYHACYAAKIARFRGIDFSRSVVRVPRSRSNARRIERAAAGAPRGFFRIGVMGDPSFAWERTVLTVEWLAPYAVPVIITKHWLPASDEQLRRLVSSGAILNTSVSALDSPPHLAHRLAEIRRYSARGGCSVARVVSCDFNAEYPGGVAMRRAQAALLEMRPVIDNPLRVGRGHPLVARGVILLREVVDLRAERPVSIPAGSSTYIGPCSRCPDVCGLALVGAPDVRPRAPQLTMLGG